MDSAPVTVSVTVPQWSAMGKRGLGHLYLRGNIWWMKYSIDGTAHYESTGCEKQTEAVNKLKKKLGQGKGPLRVKVADLIEDAVKYYEDERPKSHKDFALPASKALLGYFKNYLATEVNTDRMRQYRAKRKAAKKADSTINRELAFLRLAFRRALVATPPKVDAVPKFPMVRENNARQGFIEPGQYEALLAAMPEELKPLLVVGYHTGCRVSELLGLRWEQVDLEDAVIRLYETKNGEPRTIPIYGDMVKCLGDLRERTPKRCPWVFHRAGKRILDFRHGWAKATDAAGLSGLLFHDLRRSAVRNMRRAGITESVAMRISGHKTRAVFERYNIVDEADLRDAGEKLTEFLRGKMKK